MGRRTTAGWRTPGARLDPLALLLRSRFASRTDLARATGLGYQTLRTYTDSRWIAGQQPSQHVLTALAQVIPADELRTAVDAALHQRGETQPDFLTVGQRTVLEALRGFSDTQLLEVAPRLHDLLRARIEPTYQVFDLH